MSNANYRSGYAFENKLCVQIGDWFGINAVRTAGSHGPFDVIAFDKDRFYLIQCKVYTSRMPRYEDDIWWLGSAETPPNTEKWFMVWKKGKGLELWYDAVRKQAVYTALPSEVPTFFPPKGYLSVQNVIQLYWTLYLDSATRKRKT